METESSLRNVVFSVKDRMAGNVQNFNIYIVLLALAAMNGLHIDSTLAWRLKLRHILFIVGTKVAVFIRSGLSSFE
jgi:hypothetical protein